MVRQDEVVQAHDAPGPRLRGQEDPKGAPALDVDTVSNPGGPQLSAAPPQQDGGLGGTRAPSLQEHLEAASLGPMQIVIEDQLGGDQAQSRETPGPGTQGRHPTIAPSPHRAVVGGRGLELGAREDGRVTGLSRGYQEGALSAVPAVVPARPGRVLGAACAVVPGPALRVVPQAQAHLKIRGQVVAAGGCVLIRTVPAVVLPVAQLVGLHAGLVLAMVMPQGTASLGG